MSHPSRWELYETDPPRAAAGWQLDTVVPAARHFPTNGIRVAPDGRLWITQTRGRHVTALDLATNEQHIVVPLGAGLRGPDDLVFDEDGNAFFTEPHDDRVMRFTRDGAVEVWAENLPSANGIALSRDQRVFIDECRPGGRLIELDRRQPGKTRVILSDLALPNGFDAGPDGWLYLPEVAANHILAVHPDRGESRIAVDGVSSPSAVKFDPHGRLVTTEAGSGRVTRVDLATGERTTIAELIVGLDNLAFDGDRALYVSSFVTGAIVRIDLTDGTVEMMTPPGLVATNALAPAGDGRWLVTDRMSVAEVDAAGNVRRVVSMPVDMNFTAAGAALADGTLFVLTIDGRLMRRSASGTFVDWSLTGTFGAARAMCLTGDGNHVIVGVGTNVLFADGDGHVVRSVDTGHAVTAVATNGDDVVTADHATASVVLIEDGRAQRWRDFADTPAVGLATDAVFVAEESTRQIVRIDRATGERAVVATALPFGSPLAQHANGAGAPSLAIDRDDTLIVGCSGDASIRRLRAR